MSSNDFAERYERQLLIPEVGTASPSTKACRRRGGWWSWLHFASFISRKWDRAYDYL